MLSLTGHDNERIRGEAYYCVGYIPLTDSAYICSQEFLREGLADQSLFVQACCANVLKNFWPLEEETEAILTKLLSYHVMRMHSNELSGKLVYYASIALNYRGSAPAGPGDHAS